MFDQTAELYDLFYDWKGDRAEAEKVRDITGEGLIEVARGASIGRILDGSWGDEPFRLPEWVLLLHAAHHATEHRQQIATILTALGVEPPEPDVVAYWHAMRERDASVDQR